LKTRRIVNVTVDPKVKMPGAALTKSYSFLSKNGARKNSCGSRRVKKGGGSGILRRKDWRWKGRGLRGFEYI
jgi:hypothetical protein